MSREVDDIADELRSAPRRRKARPSGALLSSGSTPVNLAVSGKSRGAFAPGKYYHLVGDSDSGKTFLSLTTFAEAAISEDFKDYRFIHDNPEDGSLMDMSRFFGRAVSERIEPPAGTREDPVFSSTIEEFYYHVDDALKGPRPCIYVLDSLDVLDAKQDQEKFQEQKAGSRGKAKKKETGSYGMAKAKATSRGFRVVFNRLKRTKSILIIISQSRANVSMFSFEDKTYSGGHALKFYAHAQLWTSVAKTLKKKVKDRDREIGIMAQVRVRKNRHTGRKSAVKVPIYWGTGIDDVGGMIDYLVEEGHWKRSKQGIDAKEFGATLAREALVEFIETGDGEAALRIVVSDVWDEIRDACVPKRKRRYE